jgi:hypothetical protein
MKNHLALVGTRYLYYAQAIAISPSRESMVAQGNVVTAKAASNWKR